MKAITFHVDESRYEAFKRAAAERGTTASELIRTAMETYEREHLSRKTSVFDHEPAEVGEVVHPFGPDDDLLEEMLR
jgi:hypothetical protein